MASIKTITVGTTTYNIAPGPGYARIFYGTCATAAATVEKTVVCTEFTSDKLVIGAMIMVTFDATNTGAVANLTLNVNSTGAKPIKKQYNYSISTLNHAGEIRADNTYLFAYDGTNWVCNSLDYNTDSNYAARPYYMRIKPFTTLYRYQILLTKDLTTLLPINAVSNSTATTKTLTTESFDPFGPIFYYGTTTTRTTSEVIGDSTLWTNGYVDLRYSFNTGSTLTAYKAVFLVAEPQSDGSAKLHATPITQTLPTSEDGLLYIYLGVAYSTTSLQMVETHPIYVYKNGRVHVYADYANNVNDATLTMQQNGTNLGSFSANASTGATINITTPSIFVQSSTPTANNIGDLWIQTT